jgi:hypothetical protein
MRTIQNTELLNIKVTGMFSYHWALKWWFAYYELIYLSFIKLYASTMHYLHLSINTMETLITETSLPSV